MKVILIQKKNFIGVGAILAVIAILLMLLGINVVSVAKNVIALTQEKPIYFVYTDEKKMALSFDAAWGAENTPKLLQILKDNDVKATFFLTNIWLKDYGDIAKQIADDGHEIGMHSASHPHFNELSKDDIVKEIEDNRQMIVDKTNYEPILMRLPFGEYNNTSICTIKEMGYFAVQWTIDTLDWQDNATADSIYKKVSDNMQNGAIILCHNNGKFTPDALDKIIKTAKENGYSFVPIGELIYKNDTYTVDNLGGQRDK